MRSNSLRWLVCPAGGCQGALSPINSFPPIWNSSDSTELVEGVLKCNRCRLEYPVILGVALLETDLQSYLSVFWSEIESCAAAVPDTPLSRSMRTYLGVPSAFSGHSGPPPELDRSLEWTTSPYLQAHYDRESLGEDLPEGWWRDAVGLHSLDYRNPYSYLLEAARQLSGSPGAGLAVEVGTSVGRGSAELAGCYAYSVGVDRSFRAILTARRRLLSRPAPLNEYQVQTEKGRWEPRQLPVLPAIPNLDFVVASGAALPVAAGAASCGAALNVLCAVSAPLALLEELSRVLRRGGALLVSSPFWSDSEADGGSPFALGGPELLHEAVRPGFDIVAEDDMVPWVLRLAKRRWNVYLCHCVVATKR